MKLTTIALFIFFSAAMVNAQEIFTGNDLKELMVVEITADSALIRSINGEVKEVAVGDIISNRSGKVVIIDNQHIIVQIDDENRLKMSLVSEGVLID